MSFEFAVARICAPSFAKYALGNVGVVRYDLGGEREQIVGFLDYRGLPWIPIVGVLTVAT